MSNSLPPLLTMLLGQVPYFAIWIVGLILALVNWSKYPRPALLTTLAVVLMFLASLGYSFLFSMTVSSRAMSPETDIAFRLTVLGWARSLSGVIAFGLLFWAVFGWRTALAPVRRRPLREEDEEEAGERAGEPSTDIRTSRGQDRG